MKSTDFSRFVRSKWGFILLNIVAAALIGLVLLILVVGWLKRYTQHGMEVEVPQVTGLYIQEAEVLLQSNHLRVEVIDSTFTKAVPLGTIVEQNPSAQSMAKYDRVVYVVLNARQCPKVTIPELHDLSYRQAENNLSQLGLIVDSILYEPSEYKDLVLDLLCGEHSLETGDQVSEGTHVVLVVGFGQGTEQVPVPDLRGRNIKEARRMLLDQRLTLGLVDYDVMPDDNNRNQYVIYTQEPASGQMLLEGRSVNVKLSMDVEKTITEDNERDEENFF